MCQVLSQATYSSSHSVLRSKNNEVDTNSILKTIKQTHISLFEANVWTQIYVSPKLRHLSVVVWVPHLVDYLWEVASGNIGGRTKTREPARKRPGLEIRP